MKILVVCQRYFPEQFLLNEITPALANRGHEVTALVGLPNYPEGKVLPEYRCGKNRKQNIDGVNVIRCFEIGRGSGYFRLGLNYLSYMVSASIKAFFLHKDYDIVFSYQMSPVLMALPAIVYKKRRKVPVFLYCCDIWPESLSSHVKSKSSILYRLVARFSKFVYNAVDVVAVASRPFIEYMHRVNDVPLSALRYYPQHAGSTFLTQDLTAEENGVTDFMFAGNLGHGQTLGVIIKAVAILRERNDFCVHFVGDGACLCDLKKMSHEERVEDKVKFHGRFSFAEMGMLYKKADALLITLRGNNEVGKTMPTKLQTYMTTGKPIFGAINGAAEEVIRESECGRTVPAGDYEGLACLMKDFIENPHIYSRCGENARKYFKDHFTLEGYIDWLENEFKQLVNK